ncbi:MAG: oligosaccharide flippase family protein, partial [Deltaproteobacteria bacterium]|nr:oligosaccharide flippase family protein [Deltaproteobacteria bacterium]
MSADTRKADAKHAAAGGGTNLLAVIAGLILPAFHMLVARVYGVKVYGLYALGLGVTDPMVRFCSFGTDKGLLRHIPTHRVANEQELEERSLATAFWLTVIVGVLLTIIAEVFAGPLARLQDKPEVVTALRYLAPSAPFAA